MLRHPQSVLDYFARVGAEVLNFRRAMIKIYRGGHYYTERALINIDNVGNVTCKDPEFAPTEKEAEAMKRDLAGMNFPRAIEVRSIDGLRSQLQGGPVYTFVNRATGLIRFVQERVDRADGSKWYKPWVMLSDGDWASMEPDGDPPLPLWQPPASSPPKRRIMIHEGAKCATAANGLGSDHPWYEFMSQYEHWGLIGGALAPHRTDLRDLLAVNPTEVIYFCDNDFPGINALKGLSSRWRRPLKGIVPGDDFPKSWDIADALPNNLFVGKRYCGPLPERMLQSATWATVPIETSGRGKPALLINPHFAEAWSYVIKPEVFIFNDWPHRHHSEAEFNAHVRSFSDATDTAALLRSTPASQVGTLHYDPGRPPGIYAGGDVGYRVLNTFRPSDIKPEPGDPGPWLNFLQQLVLDDFDRLEVMRWCATLIARPDVRMAYSMLMISEQQGIGKTTLSDYILAPLVGEANVSRPTAEDVVESAFNYWSAHVRLAIIAEIYSGHSSKAYKKLKRYITDPAITVNRKFQAPYLIQNWTHLIASSNSRQAMKLEDDDRRWLVPALTNVRQPAAYWREFYQWLRAGGLPVIAWWAHDWLKTNAAVVPGDRAPSSKTKQEIIDDGVSPGRELIANVLEKVSGEQFLTDRAMVDLIKHHVYQGHPPAWMERPLHVRREAQQHDCHAGKARAFITDWGAVNMGGRIISRDPAVALADPKVLAAAHKIPLPLDKWPQW